MDAIPLFPDPSVKSAITPYPLPGKEARGAILVIPGGGYGCVCEKTEGSPIAKAFNDLGYHAFVLDYRVAPHRYPAPQQDGCRAVKMLRGMAQEFHIIPDRVAAVGFSAGGHLAASLATIAGEINCGCGDRFDAFSPVPDAVILGYPVISLEPWSNTSTGKNLLGELNADNIARFSLQNRITEKTPPAFIWHTIQDEMVSCRNSILFAEAMVEKKRPCELHLFPYGNHGMLLGKATPDISGWAGQAAAFLETQWEMRNDPAGFRSRYTNGFQCRFTSI